MKTTQTKRSKMSGIKMLLASVILFMGLSVQQSQAQCSTYFAYGYDPSGTTVEFFDSSYSAGGTAVSWDWSFGDGTSGSGQTQVHQYNFTGYALVCLTVTFSDSCSATYCDSVLTRSNPTGNCQAAFSVSVTPGTVVANFTDLSSSNDPITSYSWDFGDGSAAGTTQNPSHTYSTGVYTACLTITSSTGCTSTSCSVVSINQSSNCTAAFDAIANGTANTIDFIDSSFTSSGTITSYFWDFGDSTTSTSQFPTHTYSVAGSYYVCLTIATSTGCSDTYCYTVSVGNGSGCQAYFSAYQNPATAFMDFYDASTVNSGTVVSWLWDFGDGNVSTLANPSHNYSISGTYYVCLTISSSTGCSDTYCQSVTYSSGNTCDATFYTQATGNQAYFYNVTAGSLAIYTWDFGDGMNYTGVGSNAVNHTYSSNGIYRVCLTIQDSSCSDTYCDSVVIGSNLPCSALFTFFPDSMTANSYQFIDLSTPTQAWIWSWGDGTSSTQQNPVHTYNTVGPHTVCLTIVDSTSGCTDTFCRSVSDSTACLPVFSVTPDSLNPAGVPMSFTVYSPCGNPSSITWDFGDGTIDTTLTGAVTHVYTTSGQYTVCVCEVIGVDTFCFCDTITAYRLSNGIEDPSLSYLNLTAYPNPFSSELNVTYTLEHAAEVNVEMYTITGNRVKSTGTSRQMAGKYNVAVNGEDLSAGLYLLRITVDNQSVTQKVSLQK